jgi:hypothetical protein
VRCYGKTIGDTAGDFFHKGAVMNNDDMLNMKIEPAVKARLREIAGAEDRTISSYVRRLIDRAIEKHDRRKVAA